MVLTGKRQLRLLHCVVKQVASEETPIPSPQHRDITVIGASAGGIAPLRTVLATLPADYPAAVFVVVHLAGVVLSGMLDDGSAGLWAIKRRGGVAVVQDPHDAEFADMPRSAMEAVAIDHCAAAKDLADTLARIAGEPATAIAEVASRSMISEVRMATGNDTSMEQLDGLGRRVPFTCPECGGALWELEGGGARFRCHVGHAYSLTTLASEQAARVEAALWAGLRKLEEAERLAARMETDTSANADALQDLLALEGATVTVETSAADAIRRAEREPFDLIISDIAPQMDRLMEVIRSATSRDEAAD